MDIGTIYYNSTLTAYCDSSSHQCEVRKTSGTTCSSSDECLPGSTYPTYGICCGQPTRCTDDKCSSPDMCTQASDCDRYASLTHANVVHIYDNECFAC
jgi:hypothetical protein